VLFELLRELHTYYSIHKHLVDKEMAFLLTVPDELRKTRLLCDQYRIKQVLGKLILNAFKYTDRGIVEFGFRTLKDEIEFFVKDTGIGGLEGKESIVFNSFAKIDESDTSPGGLGIGLSLSKKLVKIMNGRIWYDSTTSKGTTFYFTIPFKSAQLKKDDKGQKHNTAPITGIKISSNQSVVL
jgi:signal transduction histidine kinase